MTASVSKTTYTESQHPFGGDIWYINDTDLAITDGGYSLIEKFIDLHPHKCWTLSLFNELSSVSSGIDSSTTDFVLTVLELRGEVKAAGIVPVSKVPSDELGYLEQVRGAIYDDQDELESPEPEMFTLYPVIMLGYAPMGHKYCWLGDRKGEKKLWLYCICSY